MLCSRHRGPQRIAGKHGGAWYTPRSVHTACVLCVITAALIACGSPAKYQWGGYEASIYATYESADERTLNKQISLLSKEVERTLASGKKVPPGKIAHLGYLSFLAGDREAAIRYFESEKEAFPESARFVDVMLARVR